MPSPARRQGAQGANMKHALHPSHSCRRTSIRAGFITTGTLIVAALSAIVLMTGCHSAPTQASASASHDPEAAGSASAADTMPALRPFDEQFYVEPAQEDTTRE
jgi:hypothetical protein